MGCVFALLVLAVNVHAQEVTASTLQALIPTTPVPGVQRTPSDINADGFSDLIWTNPFRHQLGYWIMGLDGSGNVQRKSIATFDIGAGRLVGAVGDFNGDGYADIVLTVPNRELYLWTNDGSGHFIETAMPSYPAGWQLVGAGDVDGDGQDDLLWLNPGACEFGYWLIKDGVQVGLRIIPIACGYAPIAIGYFSPSPRISIAWTSSLHDLWIWDSTGQGFISSDVTPSIAGDVPIGFGGGVAGQGITAVYRQAFTNGANGTFGSYQVLNRSFDASGKQASYSWVQTWSGFVNLPWDVGGVLISGGAPQGASLIQEYGNGEMDACAPGALSPPRSGTCTFYSYPRDWFTVGAPGNGTGPLGGGMTP